MNVNKVDYFHSEAIINTKLARGKSTIKVYHIKAATTTISIIKDSADDCVD